MRRGSRSESGDCRIGGERPLEIGSGAAIDLDLARLVDGARVGAAGELPRVDRCRALERRERLREETVPAVDEPEVEEQYVVARRRALGFRELGPRP
jgi:hypothetical protein